MLATTELNMKILFKTILFCLLSGIAFAQSAPDQVVNAESPQGSTVENQNFNNLYQAQTSTAATVSVINGNFVGGILQTSAGGTGVNSSQWPTGAIPIIASTGKWGYFTGIPFFNNIQIFTSSGTWIKPAGVSIVYVRMFGASGGSGAGNGSIGASVWAAGGSGAGAYAEGLISVSSNVTVTVGTAGSAGTTALSCATTATAGGSSSFVGNTTLTAGGGGAGEDSCQNATTSGGAGGTIIGSYSYGNAGTSGAGGAEVSGGYGSGGTINYGLNSLTITIPNGKSGAVTGSAGVNGIVEVLY